MTDSTPIGLQWEVEDGRADPAQRFALYRLCECEECGGTGKPHDAVDEPGEKVGRSINLSTGQQTEIYRPWPKQRCAACRGEGRNLELVATCGSPEATGLALVTLAREGEFVECPLGLLDRQGESGKRWLIRPWLPSPRNVSDAGRVLGSARRK
jgi:hypothetical protein